MPFREKSMIIPSTSNGSLVHEYAIKGQNDNDLHQKDRNNNLIISTKPSWGTRSCSGIVTSRRELSEPPLNNRITSTNLFPSNRYLSGLNQDPEPTKLNSTIRGKYDLESMKGPTLTLKDRKILAEAMTSYLGTQPPQFRYVPTYPIFQFFFNIAIFCHFFFNFRDTPGYDKAMTIHERIREGIDCDEVFPNLVLGNGCTVKKKDYLKRIGITHILNAAEYRGVNVGRDYFNQIGDKFKYLGFRIEDTPQTQICRYFTFFFVPKKKKKQLIQLFS